jgi:hypothetical protein
MLSLNKQVAGNHYSEMAIQPAEFIIQNKLSFCQGNVIKYVTRYRSKNGLQDLDKAIHYIEMMKDELKLEQEVTEAVKFAESLDLTLETEEQEADRLGV